jgi:Ca-activated chloride channel family protein
VVALGSQPRELVSLGKVDATALASALTSLAPADGKSTPTLGLEAAFANLPTEANRTRHVAVLWSGALPPGAEPIAIGTLVLAQARAGTPTSALGVGHAPYDDTILEGLAHAGRGHYTFVDTPAEAVRVLDHVRRPIVATAARLTVTFDPDVVSLYRLIGFESRVGGRTDGGSGTEPSVLRAGEATTVLFELKLAAEPKAKWGEVELRYIAADAKPQTVAVPIVGLTVDRPVADAGSDMLLAVVAAGVAEKLRGSYWARTLSWSQLAKLHGKLPATVGSREDVAGLGQLVEKLKELDKRGDRYESLSPQARMDFDRLPVLQ